jgi:phage tail sheath gpL-like
MAIKTGMHVSVTETGARGVVTACDGETATVRLRGEDKRLTAESLTLAVAGLKGERGRPMTAEALAALDATPAAAPEAA